MFYAKHRSRRKKMKFVKGIAMLLCLVTIFTSVWVGNLGIGAEGGASGDFKVKLNDNSVTSVVLPQDEKITLTVDENAGKQLRWQICADKSSALWVNISGQTKNFLTLSYAMVGSLLDRSGTTYVRCVADGKISTEVKVTLSYSVREPAVSANEPVRKAPVLKGVNPGDLTSYTIKVEYVYSDGTPAYEPYIANIEAGGSFTDTVKFPPVVGYLAYFGEAAVPSTEYKIDIPEVNENVTYTVTYKPTRVKFSVHHNVQNILDDNYQFHTTTPGEGLTGTPVGKDLEITIDGFTPLWYDDSVLIAADGSTEIEIRYERNYYLFLFDLVGGYGVEPVYTRYGATVSVNRPTKPGYVFDGWELTSCGKQVDQMDDATAGQKEKYDLNNSSVTLPDMNLKYTAKWKEQQTTYTVVYWAENADDDGYSYLSSKKVGAMSASTVSGADDYNTWDEKKYFTYNSEKTDKNKIVEGDGSTVVNVYYKRKTYTLTFKGAGEKILSCGKVEHKHSDSCCKNGGTGILHWRHDNDCCKLGLSEHTHSNSCYKYDDLKITAKYQQDIHQNFPIKDGDKTIWWTVPSGCQSFVPGNFIGSIDTMPGENITFEKYSSESGAKIYYYVETVNGEAGDTTHNGKNYKQYKVIDLEYSSSTSLTYAEEFHDIKGFEQGDSDPKIPVGGSVKMKRNNYLYYTRKTFNLKFYNYNAEVSGMGGSVQYEAPLNGYDFVPEYPKDMELNAYVFAGWYTTPGCYADSKFDLATAKMPASDLTLYAKWAPKTHTVRIYEKYAADFSTETPIDEQQVLHGNYAKAPGEMSLGSYTFNGWFYMDGTEKKAFDINYMPVNKDLDIFAEWSSNEPVLYTIRYVDENGNKIAEPTIGSALAGTSKTFIAKGGSELYADYQKGYFPETNSHTILMNIDGGNEFTFKYVKKDKVPFTVRYLEKGTEAELIAEKNAESDAAVITETFKQKAGYMPDAYQKRLVLSANPNENVLTFWYTKDENHAYYIITHWVQNLDDDGYTEYRSIQGPGEIGIEITETPLTLTGFNYNSGKSTASGTLTAKGLVLDLYYDRIEYTYTVRYLEYGTDKVLHDEKTSDVKYRYGKVVTENAIDIPGYSLVGEETKALTIRDKDKDNVITFYYSEKQVSVKYVPVPADKGVLSIGSETVGAKTGTPNGSTPTANSGYRFVGWFTDEACTNPVPAEWVGADNKLVPQKNANDLYEAATYYAKFESSLADLTIKKSGCNEEIDENQSFIFRIKGNDENTNGIDLKVVIKGNGEITIADLPVGNYTVTEETSWSWRYTPDEASKNVDLEPEGDSVEFKNTRSDDKWLSGDAHKPNKYN